MDVKSLSKRMTGYTAKVPGTKASKSRLRRVLLSMVRQLEIETTSQGPDQCQGPDNLLNARVERTGEVPCLFGTLTSQRYQWNQLIEMIATVEREKNPELPQVSQLSKGKRRELVNKYPLIVAWYAALRLELVLKTVVVPIFNASAYAAVFEWSPTGGMLHLHYILWKRGSPRFDLRAEELIQRAKKLQRAGVVAAAEVQCDMSDVIDFFSKYINEWNPNKDSNGNSIIESSKGDADQEHPAALDLDSLLELLKPEKSDQRMRYYKRCVQKEHLHEYHYPDPLGPPSYAQPCASLLKGTSNMYYCKNGYPRDLVLEARHENIAQDALRPDLWRVNMGRNCPLMNPHMPLVTCVMQSNTDACPVCTLGQSEKYLCKYCSKHCKRQGQKNVLFDVIDDMKSRDQRSWDKDPETFEATKLGSKMHRAFMAEVGEEMCQAELAHHANQSPEYLISRPTRDVFLYKKAQAISIKLDKKQEQNQTCTDLNEGDEIAWVDDDEPWYEVDFNEEAEKKSTRQRSPAKPSDVDLYERRSAYKFPTDSSCCKRLPHARFSCSDHDTCHCHTAVELVEVGDADDPRLVARSPDEQLGQMSVFQFFWLVRYIGGHLPRFEWHDDWKLPIVLMSPAIKLMEGPDFTFGARWCLMQQHAWSDRREFLDMSDEDIETFFRSWMQSSRCPWYVVDDYLKANGMQSRLGAGSFKTKSPADVSQQKDQDEHDGMQTADDGLEDNDEVEEEFEEPAGEDDLRVLRALRDGYVQEIQRSTETERRCSAQNIKHDFYKKTRCTSIAQEEQSATAAGVINVYNDSDDDEDYFGEQKEVRAEMQELKTVEQWINPTYRDVDHEAQAQSAAGDDIDLRCPRDANGRLIRWEAVKKALAPETSTDNSNHARNHKQYYLDDLDPTQRAFADRVLSWGAQLCSCYNDINVKGKPRDVPLLRTWLCGSAGSGKSTTLKTIVQELRKLFEQESVPARIELTAYTGVAAFNIGFGARTTCSGFQIFPNANWNPELRAKQALALEAQWRDVELLIVDEISFIGRALFARMHYRLQQGRRAHFSETAKDPADCQFGDISIILVGDFGQLEPIDDFSLSELHPKNTDCPQRLNHLWKHATLGFKLTSLFKEAVLLKRVHRSEADMWWTKSCLRLRNLDDDNQSEFVRDYERWRQHDLDRGHFSEAQKQYFETNAVWLCARCEDVGVRNGRKLAHLAQDSAQPVHRVLAYHSARSARYKSAEAFSGLRSVVNLVRGCKIMITRNVCYNYGLANGTRGTLVGVVYPRGSKMGTFPEAIVVSVPDYCGPVFYSGEPTWVPILAMTDYQGSQSRTQFPIVAGFAMTINKSQGLTIKEGVVVNLQGTSRFRPASLHGLPFVALTRSESFAMTAFKNIPPLDDFLKGLQSPMLQSRKKFDRRLEEMHIATLKMHSHMKSAEDEARAHEQWTLDREKYSRPTHLHAVDGRPLICCACNDV